MCARVKEREFWVCVCVCAGKDSCHTDIVSSTEVAIKIVRYKIGCLTEWIIDWVKTELLNCQFLTNSKAKWCLSNTTLKWCLAVYSPSNVAEFRPDTLKHLKRYEREWSHNPKGRCPEQRTRMKHSGRGDWYGFNFFYSVCCVLLTFLIGSEQQGDNTYWSGLLIAFLLWS